MATLQEKIAKAKDAVPAQVQKVIPPNSFKIEGYWEKGNRDISSWVGLATGIKIESDEERIAVQFVDNHGIEWAGKKEDNNPRGTKVWYLTNGIYKAKLVEGPKAKPKFIHFAVVDGKREDLTQEQVFSILQDPSDESEEDAPGAEGPALEESTAAKPAKSKK